MNITAPIEGFLPPTGELLCSFLVNTAILQDKKRRGLYFNSCPLGNIPNFSFFTSQQQGRGGEARQRPGGHGHGPVPQAPGQFDLDAVHISHVVGAVAPQGVGSGGVALAPSDAVALYPDGVVALPDEEAQGVGGVEGVSGVPGNVDGVAAGGVAVGGHPCGTAGGESQNGAEGDGGFDDVFYLHCVFV